MILMEMRLEDIFKEALILMKKVSKVKVYDICKIQGNLKVHNLFKNKNIN